MSVSNEFQAQDMQLQPAGSFVRAKNVACRRRQGAVAKTRTLFGMKSFCSESLVDQRCLYMAIFVNL